MECFLVVPFAGGLCSHEILAGTPMGELLGVLFFAVSSNLVLRAVRSLCRLSGKSVCACTLVTQHSFPGVVQDCSQMVWLLEPVLLRVPPAPTGVSFVFSWPLSLTLGKASVTVGKDLHWGLELGILFRGRVSPDAKAMGCVWSSAGFNFHRRL